MTRSSSRSSLYETRGDSLVVFDLGEGLVAGVPGNVQVTGVAASAGPEHEGAGVVVGSRPAGEPGVDVVLGAGRQARAGASQPGDQLERGPDLVVHVVGLLGGDVVPLRLPAEPAQVMPGGEAADDPALGGGRNPAGLLACPPFERGEARVAGGQDAAGHQDLAEVVGGTAGQVPVEVGVAGWPAGVADLGEDCRGGRTHGQPLQERGGAAGSQDLGDRLGVGMEAALVAGQQAEEVLAAGAAGAEPVVAEMFGGSAFRGGREWCRVLAVT